MMLYISGDERYDGCRLVWGGGGGGGGGGVSSCVAVV